MKPKHIRPVSLPDPYWVAFAAAPWQALVVLMIVAPHLLPAWVAWVTVALVNVYAAIQITGAVVESRRRRHRQTVLAHPSMSDY